jgi:hypothetical protein
MDYMGLRYPPGYFDWEHLNVCPRCGKTEVLRDREICEKCEILLEDDYYYDD